MHSESNVLLERNNEKTKNVRSSINVQKSIGIFLIMSVNSTAITSNCIVIIRLHKSA